MTPPENTNTAMTDDQKTTTTTPAPTKGGDGEAHTDVCSAVENVYSQLQAVETFMARRFDELSMEINATSQQIDMNEDGMGKRFGEILEALGAINYLGDGGSAANTGVELESVIHDTENAANTILDSADRISSYLEDDVDWNDAAVRKEVREKIRVDIQDILMACTFQDLTGQRIRNTLDSLHEIETQLSTTFERLGVESIPDQGQIEKKVGKASSQSEIDALLNGYSAAEKASAKDSGKSEESSQGDIDSMFD